MAPTAAPATPVRRKKTSARKAVFTASSKPKVHQAVDLVTGKTTIEYFFDPSLVIQGSNGNDTPSFKSPKDATDPSFLTSKFLFLPCTVIKPLDDENNNGKVNSNPHAGPTLVKTSDGTLHKISDSTKLIPLIAPDDYLGVDDVLHLTQISESSLVHTLRSRYRRDDIYTCAGPILISVNPYRQVFSTDGESIYSEDQMLLYRSKMEYGEKPPHLFQVADRAYTALMDSAHPSTQQDLGDEDPVLMREHHMAAGSVRNQSIIISGESGAGKTEATKVIMKFLARITRKHDRPNGIKSPDGKMIAALEDRVLSSNPLLETFGNAQTLRNDNSSRFGKFIHIYFNTTSGAITGASISNYLLEKTRITKQVEGERNYHIFYQLFCGCDEETKQEFGLDGGMADFNYLGNRDTGGSPKDAEDFQETSLCLSRIGLATDEQKDVFAMAAAVLHLGNITFEERGEEGEEFDGHGEYAKVTDASQVSLKKACDLLGLDEEKLTEAMLTKALTINGKTIKKPQNVAMAADKRDALAKMTYSCLFLWLVKCVNETLSTSQNARINSEKIGFIGVLDIYGFECFEVNGFEQLLINYCNEKLQRHFNRHLFEVEQELYAAEGVDWSYITFNDNRPCLDLIEGGGGIVGILNTLDDAWGGMGTAHEKDGKFVIHLHKLFGTGGDSQAASSGADNGHSNFVTPKFGSDRQFVIVHYAGEVKYTSDGFVEKNMETLSNELRELGEESTNSLSKRVYSFGNEGTSGQRSSIRGVSVGAQFRSSLQSLVADLERTQPHYIRCIKPNLSKSPSAFLTGEVLKQLRYSGMMEAIRIRREGYALREEHESFFNRFSVLLNSDDLGDGAAGIVQLVQVLSKRLHVDDSDWQIGHSKIFLRRELSDKLERFAKLRVHAAARTLGRFGRQVAFARLSSLLVAWIRFRILMLQKYREAKAATKLAATFRSRKQRQQYTGVLRAIVVIQSEQRRRLAQQQLRKLRDPYCDMSFKECRRLLQAEQSRVDDAVKANDFTVAAELEKTIVLIKEAVESKRPLTRAILDSRIEAAQEELDDAVRRKAFAECGPLQDKLEELTTKREEMPTVDELRILLRSAQSAVALAAKSRDFVGAAVGQSRLDDAKQRLIDALADEDGDEGSDSLTEDKEEVTFGFGSRTELEEEIFEIAEQIKNAIHTKDFAKASSLQQVLDAHESLRQLFPSLEELSTKLREANEQLNEAVVMKNFAKAGKMNVVIADLEQKVATESEKSSESAAASPSKAAGVFLRGEEKTFKTRNELEKEITSTSAQVAEAVAKKEFKKADTLQADADKLVKLREALPSIPELRETLRTKKLEMDRAIAAKKFASADEINLTIELLEKVLEKEVLLAPSSPERVKAPTTNGVKNGPVKDLSNGTSIAPTTPVRSVKGRPKTPGVVSRPKTPVRSKAPIRPKIPGPNGSKSSSNTPSVVSASVRSSASSVRPSTIPSTIFRPVSKLRPAKAVTAGMSDTILSVTQVLAGKRASASILVDEYGGLAGILTDTDITRRVVAKNIDPSTTNVSEVMTPNPTCVATSDSAMEALMTMVDNHFRHLPVVDDSGSVVGLLDIAKCLNDAISKLEKSAEKNNSATENAVKQAVSQQGAGGAQAEALHALLGTLMSQAFGNKTTPTLRSLLAGKPNTIVSPSTTIQEAGILMAERRQAALVVDDDGQLVGLFAFKDMMTRVVAKELPLDSTPVSAVMTPEPEVVSPDTTVLEALHTMHDNKFLTLPVCEDDGRVLGVVSVMDVIHGCGGPDGWRSIFSSAMEVEDDASDDSSLYSFGGKSKLTVRSEKPFLQTLDEAEEQRPVSKLRPSKPITVLSDESILSAVQLLTHKRGTASLIICPEGGLIGILTDKDITIRVVAKYVDLASDVSKVMTPDPTCVHMTDSAMDALMTMVENHFRHLPVVDGSGSVVGMLDIAKCLNDAISKLERSGEKNSSAAENAVMQAVSLQGAGGAQAAALKALLGTLMSQAFGSQASPTLRSLLAGKPNTNVRPSTSIREAGMIMSERRKAALIVDEDGRLVGLFAFKDMMTRAVAKQLPLDSTPVSSVMTPNPDAVSPDTTALEALQIMHDDKFLTLPVCEEDGTVIGIVDVMDVIHGCGGADGWRSMFSKAMDITEDHSDSVSVYSMGRSVHTPSVRSVRRKPQEKTVSNLRPSKPNISISNETILEVTQLLARKRGSASLVVSPEGVLAGILTDTDITRRVVAKDVDPATTYVSEVMTEDPTCVHSGDPAMDALMTMIENHFRHLPVVDDSGSVVGLLDIAKCLNDAISKLERCTEKGSSAAEDAVKQAVNQQGASGAQAMALQALLGTIMSQAFGNKTTPTLRTLLAGKQDTIVSPSTSIREAGILMADRRQAALVVDDGHLVGLFAFEDMMTRAVAKELPLDSTPVSAVMTPDPEVVSPDTTVLEALQMMHDNHFLTLPVCEDDGRVLGVVSVMDVIHGCGGPDGWRSIFSSAMDIEDASDTVSASPSGRYSVHTRSTRKVPDVKVTPNTPFAYPNNIPSTLEFEMDDSINSSTIGDRGASKLLSPDDAGGSFLSSSMAVFKLSDESGNTHRIRCSTNVEKLFDATFEKMGIPPLSLQLRYVDEEGDSVVITCDDDVAEAWALARKHGNKVAKLSAVKITPKSNINPTVAAGGAVVVFALLGIVALVLMRSPSKK